MRQRLFDGDAPVWIKDQHPLQEVHSERIRVREEHAEICALCRRQRLHNTTRGGRLAIRRSSSGLQGGGLLRRPTATYFLALSFVMKLVSSGLGVPRVLTIRFICSGKDCSRSRGDGGASPRGPSPSGSHLVHVVLAGEQRLPRQQLGKDAADRPDVDRRGVVAAGEQKLWGPVPPCHDVFGHELLLVGPGARQTKVADLEVAVGVDEEVARLQVPVQHVGRVDEAEPPEDLVDKVLAVLV